MPRKASRRVRTLKSFMEWAGQFNDGEYAFRGVSNEKYIIEASTYRRLKDKNGKFRKEEDGTPEKLLKINEEMIEEANRQGHGKDMKDLELLAELQHRGAATCLIDFTQNPLVALWMACREGSSGAANGKVFAVDISSQVTFKPVDSKLSQAPISDFLKRNKNEVYQLHQWQPNYENNRRMLAQQSIFLFGSANIEAVSECIVFKNSKQDILNSLEKSAGITEGSLFPDFDGFASQRAQNKAYVEPDAQYYLTRGRRAAQEGKIDEAIDYYFQGISLNPDEVLLSLLYLFRSYVYDTTGEYDRAIKDCSDAIEVSPGFILVYYNRGIFYGKTGKYDLAIEDYNEWLRHNQDHVEAYINRGTAKFKLKRYEEAIADFDAAIHINPNEAGAYNNRGVAKLEQGQHEEAIADFDAAIHINPNEAGAYNNRGFAKSKLKRYEETIADCNEAIHLAPNEAAGYFNRGVAKLETGYFSEFEQDLQTALQLAEKAGNAEQVAEIEAKLDEFKSFSKNGDSDDE